MGSNKIKVKTAEEGGFKTEGAGSGSAWPAEVVELTAKIGTKQGGMQVRVRVLDGPDQGKIMRRNVLGPVRKGDFLMLRQTEIEASPVGGRRS